MKAFDTHTHTNSDPLDKEFQSIKEELEKNNILANIVGYDIETSTLAVEQAKESKNLYASIAIHPNDVKRFELDKTLTFLEELFLKNKDKVIAIGECGLDYHYENDDETKRIQQTWFRKQIELAEKLNLPVNMHIRDAHYDAQAIINEYKDRNITFIVHCFTGNKKELEGYLKLNCFISIPGVVTFKNSQDLREALKLIPKDKLLSETDAPWLAPVPFRGKTNYPYFVLETNKFLANELNIPYEELTNILYGNALKAFKIKC